MHTKLGINGFGRIGRATFRAAHEQGADLEWVGINDVMDTEMLAHLLRHDSVYGPFPGEVEVLDGAISRRRHRDPRLRRARPRRCCPGASSASTSSSSPPASSATAPAPPSHLEAGARKVIISAPAKEPDITVALGVNFETRLRPRAPPHHLQRLLHDQLPRPRREGAPRSVRHPPRRDDHDPRLHRRPAPARRTAQGLRRARSAAVNLVPTSTGAAKAIGLVIPELAGRLQGYAVRVPVPTGSLVDLTVELERETSAQAVNAALRERADHGALTGILAYSEEPLVSTDIVKSPYSDLRLGPHARDRRHPAQGGRLVRQRMGLLQPARRARPARARARPGGRSHEGTRLPRPRRARLGHRPRPDASSTRPTSSSGSTRSTICGTDLHILKGDVPETTPGTVLGHEAVGTVQEVGAERHHASRSATACWCRASARAGAAASARRAATASASAAAAGSSATRSTGCRPSTRACRSRTTPSTRCPTS